jgi:hypothetical protein
MDIINTLTFGLFGLLAVLGCKTLYDQSKLIRLYRRKVDSRFPLKQDETAGMLGITKSGRLVDPLGLDTTGRYLRIVFMKHSSQQDLARQARLVRIELFSVLLVMVGGFALLTLLIFTSRS